MFSFLSLMPKEEPCVSGSCNRTFRLASPLGSRCHGSLLQMLPFLGPGSDLAGHPVALLFPGSCGHPQHMSVIMQFGGFLVQTGEYVPAESPLAP